MCTNKTKPRALSITASPHQPAARSLDFSGAGEEGADGSKGLPHFLGGASHTYPGHPRECVSQPAGWEHVVTHTPFTLAGVDMINVTGVLGHLVLLWGNVESLSWVSSGFSSGRGRRWQAAKAFDYSGALSQKFLLL